MRLAAHFEPPDVVAIDKRDRRITDELYHRQFPTRLTGLDLPK